MITVFTPTYNRAYILPNLYQSLKIQTMNGFEWLIVDDGSQDETENLVKCWQKECKKFPIVYLKQSNGGKHRAINYGLKKAKGEWFFIVDSDDWLPANAIQKITKAVEGLSPSQSFAGICGLKADKWGYPVGNSASLKNILDASMIEIRQKYHIKGDMAEVFKTNILRQFPFPEFKGENFLNEAVVWNKIAERYRLRYVPEVFYFCEYREDGLTKSIRKKYRQNPLGTSYLYLAILKSQFFDKKAKIRAAILYWRYLCFNKKAYLRAPFFIFFFWPAGYVLALYDLWKGLK